MANGATSHDPAHEAEAKAGSDESQPSSGTVFHLSAQSTEEANIDPAMSIDSRVDEIAVSRAAAETGVPPIPPCARLPRKAKKGPNPKPHHGRAPRTFRVVYESKGYHQTQRFEVPSTESYEAFMARMARVSRPVAGSFIAGRDTGFSQHDGPWRYRLASRKLGIEQPGADLTSNIMYQCMISEILKAHSPWNWAIVWHVSVSEFFH